MGSIHNGSCVSSITPYCGWMLDLVRNSTETLSNRSVSIVEASFANTSVFEFLLHGIISTKAAENKFSCSFALSK